MPRLTQADLKNLNQNFEPRSPEELIRWAYSVFGGRLAGLSAMQQAGCMIAHMISQLQVPIPILFVDTGVNFQETLDTRDRLMGEYGVQIRTLHPRQTMAEQTAEHGVLYLTVDGQKQCCHVRKVEPLRAVSGEYDALLGSLRRAEGGKRGNTPILSLDLENNCLRINVLANVDDDAFEAYLSEHRVITNPLHEQGFTTIGCNRCTTPVMPGEPARAGRWRHLGPWSMYCGINPTDLMEASEQFIDLPQSLIDRILGLESDFAI